MRVLALVLGALALGAGSPPSWQTFGARRVTVRVPPGWFATARPLTSVTAPRQALAVASFRLPGGPRGADGCEPKEALDEMPSTGAFLFGWEYGQPLPGQRLRDFPPRPTHFRLTSLARTECMGTSYVLRFRAAGRLFQIHVAFGREATAATRATALRILDSFHARPS